MKKIVLALTVLAFCSVSFAAGPGLNKVNPQKEAAAAGSQDIADQTAPNSPSATTNCQYNFATGSNNSYLGYCVTVNGNILNIATPLSSQSGADGEGYGICNETPALNYTDYATSDTGNWNAPILLSHTTSSVKIARTTSDGNWTLTQTITQVPSTVSIKIVMALKNNQAVSKVAYLVRYVDVSVGGFDDNYVVQLQNSSFAWLPFDNMPNPSGLLLENVGVPPFGFWHAYAQNIDDGPNACAFAYNSIRPVDPYTGPSSLVMAYVGPVPASGTKTVTVTYRGM
jgi:hypothetical protein